MSGPLLVALGAALGALLGLLAPRMIAALPEPQDDPAGSEADVAARDAERARRAALPSLSLWGMRPDDDTKEPYPEIAALPAVRRGCVVAGAVLGAVLVAAYGTAPVQVVLLGLVPVGLALAVVDWRTRLLPARIVLPATAAVLVLALVAWPLYDARAPLLAGLLGLLLARSVYWVMYRFMGAGFGDVRLAALLGLVLAYVGWAEWLLGLWAGFVLFSVPGLGVALLRRDRRYLKVGFPFGPFMLLGAVVGLVLGDTVVAGLVG